MYKYILFLFPLLKAFLSLISFFSNGTIITDTNDFKIFYDNNMVGLIAFIFLALFYSKYRLPKNKINPLVTLLTIVFTSFMVIGKSFRIYNGFDWIFYSKKQFAFIVVIFIGYFLFFHTSLTLIFHYTKEVKLRMPKMKGIAFFQKNVFVKSMCIIFLLWLPYLIIYYPGTITWDVFAQLNYYFGVFPWSNWHPIFHTLIMGFLMNLGRMIHSDNLGIFLISMFQSLLFSFSLSYSVYSLKKWKIPDGICLLSLLFYALHPLFPLWAQAPFKDVLFSSFVIIFLCILIDCLRDNLQLKKRFFPFLLVGILVCLTRHNGIYLVAPTFFMLIVSSHIRKKPLRHGALLLILSAVIYFCLSNTMISVLNADKGSIAEALSIPFQQTARYVVKYSDEVTEEEKTAISKILDYDSMKDEYDPSFSNPVKDRFNRSATKKDLLEYFKIWGKMFLKHPLTYLEATLANSYIYYCPDGNGHPYTHITQTVMEMNPTINTGFFDIQPSEHLKPYRDTLLNITNFLAAAPAVSLLFYPAFYTWIYLIAMTYLIMKKQYLKLVVFIPGFINILVCIAGPLNGNFRYYLPNFCITFFLLSWCIWGRLPGQKSRSKGLNGHELESREV